MKDFKDHFSSKSDHYLQYRPNYPVTLYHWLASISPTTHLAWDCATGSGQAAQQLAEYFEHVIATDASQQQINQVSNQPNIHYEVAQETCATIKSTAIDLITVAQALHWFDRDLFFYEVRRVLKPGGILAIWSYNLLTITPEINHVINELYHATLDGYWPEERVLVEEGYQSITLPYPDLSPDSFTMKQEWDLPQLLGYLGTWSAVKRYTNETGINPLTQISATLKKIWGNAKDKRTVTWLLGIRTCQKPF